MPKRHKKAPKKVLDKIKKAIKNDKVEFAGDITKIDLQHPNFAVTNASLAYAWSQAAGGISMGFEVHWETVSGGFGVAQFYVQNGKFYCDNEEMSKFFLATVLMKLLDTAELTG